MPELDQRPQVTIEDLLRLKRAERPAAEFWTNFERELRQKQLTALLEKRPWWQELPQILARRAYLPVGATAILAFTLVSVKFYAPAQLAQVPVPAANPSVAVDHGVALPSSPVSSPLVNRSESIVSVRDESTGAASVTASAATPVAGSAEVVELMPLLVAPQAEKPSARLLASNSATLEQSEVDFAGAALGNRLSAPARVQATAAAEELASVPTNAARRNHLLAQYGGRQLNPEPLPPAVVRERLARRLGDTESTDRSSRFARDSDAFVRPMPQIVALRF
ncbi:hypothetical protein [Opitutus sp. GAS368]|jgi:hypothetical protein|uniref:hypothetical protein n=1 Tax=Opitutus sp. GAS368 TaxID=1882749 RepID=UPI00087A3FDF|nr:hypothetical protein [Opitutus sp. GAS368]SDS11763.1 hypothetical protein SAMN05444173_1939 [Opitutus sp. GAS368]